MSTHKTRTKKTSRQKNEKEKGYSSLNWQILAYRIRTKQNDLDTEAITQITSPVLERSPALTFRSQTTDNTTSDQRSDEDTDLIKLQSALCNAPSCLTCGKQC